jgi:hypothetical protein
MEKLNKKFRMRRIKRKKQKKIKTEGDTNEKTPVTIKK